MMRTRHLLAIVVVCGAVGLATDVARACDVPVFRYAMERWRPDPYPMVIFHRGTLSDEHQKIAKHIERAAEGDDLNVVADTVDLADEPDPAASEFWGKVKDKSLPRLMVLRPRGAAGEGPVWSSEITMDAVKAILDSPARTELARRLLKKHLSVDRQDAAVDGPLGRYILLYFANKLRAVILMMPPGILAHTLWPVSAGL